MYNSFLKTKSVIPFLAILFLSIGNLKSQEFKILDINTDEYPTITARYLLTNQSGKKVTDLTKEEVRLIENDQEREIIYLKNPEIKAMPLSILLIFDISGSMKNNRMKIAKEAARGLIDEVDLLTTEIAISTFNFSAFLNCDFTHDSARLMQAVNDIEPLGGTSYEDAFLSDLTGGIEITKQGKYKKVIIFMTDGLGNANADTIVNLAKKENITVFTTTIELDMPPVLNQISSETGGYSFAQVNDPKTSKTIYSKLYRDIVATEYGVMKWMAADDCEEVHEVSINARRTSVDTNFELPIDPIEGLVVIPSSLFVRSQQKDSMATKYFRIASPHKPISITNILSSNPEKVRVEIPDFPLELRPGDNYQLKVNYTVRGSSEDKYQVKIYTENCLKRSKIDIEYGVPGKIEVIKPATGDLYGAGMDTIIEWGGVSKNQPIALYYRYGNTNWQKITEATGLKYNWETPLDTSSTYQVMAKPADATDFSKKYEILGQMRDIRVMDVSNDGSLFITRDVVGLTSVWQDGNPRPVKVYREPASKFVYFSKDDLRLLDYFSTSIIVRDVFTNTQKKPIYDDNYKIFAATPTLYGDEYLMPIEVSPINNTLSTFTDLVTSNMLFRLSHDDNAPLFAAKSANSPYVLIMNRDYSLDIHNLEKERTKNLTRKGDVVTKAYINPNGKYAYVEEPEWKGIVGTNRGRPVINFDNDFYVRFSPDGDRLITMAKGRTLSLWDLNTQKKLGSFPNPSYFNFSYNGNMFYTTSDSLVTLFDIYKGKVTHKIFIGDYIRDISISQDGSEILITTKGKAEIYDCFSGGLKFTIIDRASPIMKAVYANNNKIITISQDKSISTWEPSMSPESGLSGKFGIVSPLPDVTPEYNIGVEIVGQRKEAVLEKFVTNNSQFPIRILRYEWGAFVDEYALVSSPPPFPLQPGESKDVEIRFSPSDTKEFPTSISVITPGGIVQSKITGVGIDKKYALPNKLVDFGKIELGTKKDTTVVLVKNISEDVITIDGIKNSGPDTEQFLILRDNKKVELSPGETLESDLRYSALFSGRASGGFNINIEEQNVYVQLFGEGLGPKGVFIKGRTIDQDNSEIEGNVICKELETGRQFYDQLTDSLGNFGFSVFTPGSFILFAEKDGYMSASENIELEHPFVNDTLDVIIVLSKIENGSLFRLNGVFFEFAKATLISSSKTDLDRVLQLLQKDKSLNLEVHGHTDEIGTEESNLALSKNRANAVRNYLIENGVYAERISIQFFGESKPIATNETDEGRQLNRRVEFLIK